jgi:hypothetical protein
MSNKNGILTAAETMKQNNRNQIIDFLNSVDFLQKETRFFKINNSKEVLTLQVKIILSKEIEKIINFIKTLENEISFSVLAMEENSLLFRFNI